MRFVALTLIASFVAAALVAAVNWHLNVYGVFGDAHGSRHTVIANERQTKYLYSFNYIPANFDALLVGSSVASNIDTSKIGGLRMYNAALSGGNISEERLIAENALRRGHFRLLLICLNPYLLGTHGRKAGGMSPDDLLGALGSTDLISTYIGALAIGRGWAYQRFNAEGAQDIAEFAGPVAGEVPAQGAQVRAHDAAFTIDETAWGELVDLVTLARIGGATVVWMFPPVYLPTYQAQYRGYVDFEARIRALAGAELVVNFNDSSFEALTGNSKSFLDGVHLSKGAARTVTQALDGLLATPKAELPSG
jgi:hypothetical protein